ncbi:conjugative transposon protein TraN [Chitinophaga varians]|uniref:conjugative transposon protein TraN n=1 Tax=Chitinophaga varians TaxID=2202339 RepID=UPI00165F123B|nr:conjugative transposon protein TraN [Chitinophaga varians]MBC9909124.1 conjugative transposon protein TraN [Chitinophaga varians]
MKQCVSLFFVIICVLPALAQVPTYHYLPATTVISPYTLEIGFNKTTILMFPAPIRDADRGQRDVIVDTVPGVSNVVRVKATRKGFQPTNLNVFTKDGRLYSFEVLYAEAPVGTTFDLSRVDSSTVSNAKPMPLIIPEIEAFSPLLNQRLQHIRNVRPFYHVGAGTYNMRLKLRSIYFTSDHLYLHFRIYNHSNIPFTVDFSRMYIKDKHRVKRTTSQEEEIVPVYATSEKLVPGNSSTDFVFVIKKITIPDAKKIHVNFQEKNGGRRLSLNIKNRHIFRARPLF